MGFTQNTNTNSSRCDGFYTNTNINRGVMGFTQNTNTNSSRCDGFLCKTHHTSINISICVKPITPRAISISICVKPITHGFYTNTNINRGVMGFTQILIALGVMGFTQILILIEV
jgi:hypothetical protein